MTATFYCTYTPSGFGDNGVYPTAGNNYLVKWILLGSTDSYVYNGRFPIEYSSDMLSGAGRYGRSNGTKSFSWSGGTGDSQAMQRHLPTVTILDTEWNNRIIKYFGIAGIGAFSFPDHSVFPPYQIDHLVLGEGDGVTQDFNVKCPLIMNGTARIFVNSRELDPSEYTFDYESNCGDWYENYHTAGMRAFDENVSFGDIRTRTPSTSSYKDPMAWWSCYDTTKYPSSLVVSEAKPIWIDFGTAKACNRLKIDANIVSINANYIDQLVIEHSDDNENWTAITATRSEQNWSWEELSARYWRVYIPGYNWSYRLTTSYTTRDGLNYGCSFFLGRTVPGLHLNVPPADGETVEASYQIDVPFKTQNNLLRFTCSIQLQRG